MKMDKRTERAYKRKCFLGRGALARWMDTAFSSLFGGACLYILRGNKMLSAFLSAGLLLFFVLWDRRRWIKYKQKLWLEASRALKRESWLKQEAERIRQAGGVIIYPTPDSKEMIGHCLRMGQGISFHCIGDERKELILAVSKLGSAITFHPWEEGSDPDREQIVEKLKSNMPKRNVLLWKDLLQVSGNRYMLAGASLLIISMFLRHALYWRLLGSLCLLIGAIRHSIQMVTQAKKEPRREAL